MLERLFGSKTRTRILQLVFTHPTRRFFVRELSRLCPAQLNAVRRELAILTELGILSSAAEGKRQYYTTNEASPFREDLGRLFLKSLAHEEGLRTAFAELGNVELVLLTGFFTGDTRAPVDLFIVGEPDKARLEIIMKELEMRVAHDVSYVVLSREDFLFRRNCQDAFVVATLESNTLPLVRLLPPELLSV